MGQELLGIEAEVELGCDDGAMLSELLDTGVVIHSLSGKKIRISANADQEETVIAIITKRKPREFTTYYYDNIRNSSQKFYEIVLADCAQLQ